MVEILNSGKKKKFPQKKQEHFNPSYFLEAVVVSQVQVVVGGSTYVTVKYK